MQYFTDTYYTLLVQLKLIRYWMGYWTGINIYLSVNVFTLIDLMQILFFLTDQNRKLKTITKILRINRIKKT